MNTMYNNDVAIPRAARSATIGDFKENGMRAETVLSITRIEIVVSRAERALPAITLPSPFSTGRNKNGAACCSLMTSRMCSTNVSMLQTMATL